MSDHQEYEKGDVLHQEAIHDHDLGKTNTNELYHLSHLTEEEKVVEKKLKRKIDGLIMPLVILVSDCESRRGRCTTLMLAC